jgi:Ca2+-binding RTX toxin-like protein
MRKRTILLMATIGAVLLALCAGVALAVTPVTNCTAGSTSNDPCLGTRGDDGIEGTSGRDVIDSLGGHDVVRAAGGNDTVYGRGKQGDPYYYDDELYGDGGATDVTQEGDDKLYGGYGNDYLVGDCGADLLSGGGGIDYIDAICTSPEEGEDTVKGGGGNDLIDTQDGRKDVVDCGKGSADEITYDDNATVKDTLKNCEIKHPV